MASGAWQDGAGNKTSVVALPSDILQHIYSFFEDPTDVTSCHMVDTRCAYSLALFPTKCSTGRGWSPTTCWPHNNDGKCQLVC